MWQLPVADPWFTLTEMGDGITLISEPHVHPMVRCNVWRVAGRTADLPAAPAGRLLEDGDAIYDGPLLDSLEGSDPDAYRQSLERLAQLPVRMVNAGHERSFGRERLIELCRSYL